MARPCVSGSGLVPYSGRSMQGGGYYGQFISQSIQGGGSVSGVTIGMSSTGFNPNHASTIGFFVKVASLPASDTTLADLNFAPKGYMRVKLASTGHIIGEGAYRSQALSADIGVAISIGVWYWVSCFMGGTSGSHNVTTITVQVWNSASISIGSGSSAHDFGNELRETITSTLGWGVSQSTAYLAFPNSNGNELSKFFLNNDSSDVVGPPGSDMSISGLQALYLCRDATGTTSGIVDSTANAFNLTPGPNGLLVVADGPYA